MDRSIGYRSSFGSSGFPRFMFVFGLLLFAASSCAFASQPCEPLPEASGTISGCDHGGKRNIMGTAPPPVHAGAAASASGAAGRSQLPVRK